MRHFIGTTFRHYYLTLILCLTKKNNIIKNSVHEVKCRWMYKYYSCFTQLFRLKFRSRTKALILISFFGFWEEESRNCLKFYENISTSTCSSNHKRYGTLASSFCWLILMWYIETSSCIAGKLDNNIKLLDFSRISERKNTFHDVVYHLFLSFTSRSLSSDAVLIFNH